MSVIITEMDMPKDCGECDLRVTLRFKNNLINFCPKTMKNVDLNELHNECPLKETSPHGRLIDADAYLFRGDLIDEPTIIGAEGVNE